MDGKMDKKKGFWINMIMALIMSVVMGVLASIVISMDGNAKLPPFPVFLLINVVESIVVGVVVALVIPLGVLGKLLAQKAKAAPPSMKFNLINAIPLAIGNSVIVSAVVSFINVAQAHSQIPADQAPPLFAMWMGSWAPLLIPSILISYVIAVLVSPIVVKLVMK